MAFRFSLYPSKTILRLQWIERRYTSNLLPHQLDPTSVVSMLSVDERDVALPFEYVEFLHTRLLVHIR